MTNEEKAQLESEGWTVTDREVPAAFLPGGDPKSFTPRIVVLLASGAEWPAQWSRNAHWGDVVAWKAA